MNAEFIKALDALQTEKKIDKAELITAIEESITASYKKHYGSNQVVEAVLDQSTGEISVFVDYIVVQDVLDPDREISQDEAKEYDPNLEVGDLCRVLVTPRDFGRIAAQNAKQLIIQKIKEAERNAIYAALEAKQNEIVNGVITRVDDGKGIVFVDIGDYEAALMPSEQIKGEDYSVGKRYKVLVLGVRRNKNGPQATVSRTHPILVRRLFELEVPEIANGTVLINGISREVGSRTKIAVSAVTEGLDAVGACVGQRGVRVQHIINDLGGEKIDIVKYSDDIKVYISNALSPAKAVKILPGTEGKTALAVVDSQQFSLAIGKEGQNVRLAAKLTGWKIDIKNEIEFARIQEEEPEFLIPFGIYPEGYEPPVIEESDETLEADSENNDAVVEILDEYESSTDGPEDGVMETESDLGYTIIADTEPVDAGYTIIDQEPLEA